MDSVAPPPFILTGGQANDAANALPVLAGLKAGHVIADKAYYAHAILDHIEAMDARSIIPQRSCMSRSRDFDARIYKRRNMIEHTIGRLKQLRRSATRYDRLPQNHLGSLYLASRSFCS